MAEITLNSHFIKALSNAERVMVITGAGVSAESNIPTFRDAMSGLWAQYSPEELGTPQAFRRNPKLVWDWYQWRRDLVSGAAPNPGHFALARMQQRFPYFTLVTQNVDGLHQQAGSTDVLELHGAINRTKCAGCGVVVETWTEPQAQTPPVCTSCGDFLRPDVVWFGESLPANVLKRAQLEATGCDVFFSVGTSAVVEPAASLIHFAKNHGAMTVEINPNPTAQARMVDYAFAGPSGEVLPKILEALNA